MIFFIILAIITALLFMIFMSKVQINIEFQHNFNKNAIYIHIRALFGLIKYKINVPSIKVDQDSPSLVMKEKVQAEMMAEKSKKEDKKQVGPEEVKHSIHDINQLITHIVGMKDIVKEFLKKIEVQRFEWKTVIGVKDAAMTGIVTGALWTLKGSSVGLISNLMRLKNMPILEITPNFQNLISSTSLSCMLRLRIGHAILAGIKLLKHWRGQIPTFKSKKLSAVNKLKGKQSM